MLFRFRLRGDGTSDNPYGVNLPTYNHLHGDITARESIIEIPDEVHGLSDADLSIEETHETTHGKLVMSLSEANLEKLHKNLDAKYTKGKFRVENV